MTTVEIRQAFVTALEAMSDRRLQLAEDLMQAEGADDMALFDALREERKDLRNAMKTLQKQVQDIENQWASENEYAWADQQHDHRS